MEPIDLRKCPVASPRDDEWSRTLTLEAAASLEEMSGGGGINIEIN